MYSLARSSSRYASEFCRASYSLFAMHLVLAAWRCNLRSAVESSQDGYSQYPPWLGPDFAVSQAGATACSTWIRGLALDSPRAAVLTRFGVPPRRPKESVGAPRALHACHATGKERESDRTIDNERSYASEDDTRFVYLKHDQPFNRSGSARIPGCSTVAGVRRAFAGHGACISQP